ncbi:unnamed protein product [Caretta caretta]
MDTDAMNPASIKEAAWRVEEQLDGLGLNLVINNTGIFCNTSLAMVDSEEMLGAYKTNVVGPMLVGQALSYAEDGVLCTAVHPGWVKTDMGTQEAHLPVDESVRGILAVLPTLSEKHSGSLWSWTGKTIPW